MRPFLTFRKDLPGAEFITNTHCYFEITTMYELYGVNRDTMVYHSSSPGPRKEVDILEVYILNHCLFNFIYFIFISFQSFIHLYTFLLLLLFSDVSSVVIARVDAQIAKRRRDSSHER